MDIHPKSGEPVSTYQFEGKYEYGTKGTQVGQFTLYSDGKIVGSCIDVNTGKDALEALIVGVSVNEGLDRVLLLKMHDKSLDKASVFWHMQGDNKQLTGNFRFGINLQPIAGIDNSHKMELPGVEYFRAIHAQFLWDAYFQKETPKWIDEHADRQTGFMHLVQKK